MGSSTSSSGGKGSSRPSVHGLVTVTQCPGVSQQDTHTIAAINFMLCCAVLCRLGIEEPSWEELYGNGGMGEEGHPFDEYFCKPGDDDDVFQANQLTDVSLYNQ